MLTCLNTFFLSLVQHYICIYIYIHIDIHMMTLHYVGFAFGFAIGLRWLCCVASRFVVFRFAFGFVVGLTAFAPQLAPTGGQNRSSQYAPVVAGKVLWSPLSQGCNVTSTSAPSEPLQSFLYCILLQKLSSGNN